MFDSRLGLALRIANRQRVGSARLRSCEDCSLKVLSRFSAPLLSIPASRHSTTLSNNTAAMSCSAAGLNLAQPVSLQMPMLKLGPSRYCGNSTANVASVVIPGALIAAISSTHTKASLRSRCQVEHERNLSSQQSRWFRTCSRTRFNQGSRPKRLLRVYDKTTQ